MFLDIVSTNSIMPYLNELKEVYNLNIYFLTHLFK